MTERKKSKNVKLVFSKSDIAIILNTTYVQLNRFLSDEVKNKIGWNKGRKYFNDLEVYQILKYFRPLLSDEETKKLIYPNGF
jgi:hypothetical protein